MVLVFSTKKRYSSVSKKVLVFQFSFRWLSHKNMPISQTEGYFENY